MVSPEYFSGSHFIKQATGNLTCNALYTKYNGYVAKQMLLTTVLALYNKIATSKVSVIYSFNMALRSLKI